jgi:hypothetical protein
MMHAPPSAAIEQFCFLFCFCANLQIPMLTPTSILFATVLALLAVSCDAHGRLVSPVSRGGTGYEDDPVRRFVLEF